MKASKIPQQLLSNARQIHEKLVVFMFLALCANEASAATSSSFNLPGFATLGCKVISWLSGELSVMIFFIVVVVTLVIGFFAKMDWTKILGVIVLFGLLKGAASLFGGYVNTSISCIATSI